MSRGWKVRRFAHSPAPKLKKGTTMNPILEKALFVAQDINEARKLLSDKLPLNDDTARLWLSLSAIEKHNSFIISAVQNVD